MDTLKSLGELALGSRLKRLSDQIMKEGGQLYADHNLDFEPKWFPVFYTLKNGESRSVTEIAQEIGIKHPTASQTIKELEHSGLIQSVSDSKDARKRLLTLSAKGKSILPKMEPLWKDISNTFHNLIQKHTDNILCAIEQLEDDLEKASFYDRVSQTRRERLINAIEIIPFEAKYAGDFKTLNEEWINHFFTLEEEDRIILEDPIKHIIEAGGAINLAKYQNQIVGTCALIKLDEQTFELAKMAVTEQCRGLQIGKKLGQSVIQKARELGGKTLVLESNKKLTPAITLYKKLGFKSSNQSDPQSVYERCDIKMEMEL